MNNKFIISAAISALIFAAGSAYAYTDAEFSDIPVSEADGVYTVLTDTEGVTHRLDGAISAAEIERSAVADKIADYTVYADGEAILNITLHDIIGEGEISAAAEPAVNGYYSIKFTLSEEDNMEAFLTGLTDENADETQNKILAAKLGDSKFTLEDLSYIDAEKTDDGDDNLCWAAVTSNMLQYTGWGKQSGYGSEDDIFDLYVASFTDKGGDYSFAFDWFFDGYYYPQGDDNWSQEKNPGNSGGFLKKYSAASLYRLVRYNWRTMGTGLKSLESGCGAAVSIVYTNSGNGHALTAWGYVTDNDYTISDAEYFRYIVVSNSDSDIPSSSDRRTAPNKLSVIGLEPYTNGSLEGWLLSDNNALLYEVTTLEPYSESLPCETDSSATMDLTNYPNLYVYDLGVSADEYNTASERAVYTQNDILYTTITVDNVSDIDVSAFDYKITIKNTDTEKTVTTYNGSSDKTIDGNNTPDTLDDKAKLSLVGYEPGNYCLTLELNPADDDGTRKFAEAYYYDDIAEYDFTITESSYDLSNAKITADVGEFSNDTAKVTLTYSGLNGLDDILSDAETSLYMSMSDGETWSDWFAAADVSDGALPESCTVTRQYKKVWFRLTIKPSDESLPYMVIYSDEIALTYSKVGFVYDTQTYTVDTQGATKLDGEDKFTFTLKDLSSSDESDAEYGCEVKAYAVRDEEEIELYNWGTVTVPSGSSTDELSFSSWDADLSGTYSIKITATTPSGIDTAVIGTLKIKETPSTVVTILKDTTDPYDNETSLREAAEYAMGTDKTVTAPRDAYLDAPITVDAKLTIVGNNSLVCGQYLSKLFDVTATGELICDGVIMGYGVASSGGAIENHGGKITLSNGPFLRCSSSSDGSAIYSDGGTVVLKNETFLRNTAESGATITATNGAKVDVLDCLFYKNSSANGVIAITDNSHMQLVGSTFVNNTATSDAAGGAVTASGGTADIFASILAGNGTTDVSGTANLYGCYVSATAEDVTKDSATVTGGAERIFKLTDGTADWSSTQIGRLLTYETDLSELVLEGAALGVDADGTITYTPKGGEKISTDVTSAFTEDEISHDIFGNARGNLFGASAKVSESTSVISRTDSEVTVFTPKGQSCLIDKQADDAGVLDEASTVALDYGTNTVPIETYSGEHTFMLWDSLESMIPLCDKQGENYE